MSKQVRRFTVILEPEPDSGFSVHCPALPGCVSQGDNRQNALENIKDAIVLVLETVKSEGVNAGSKFSAESARTIADEVYEVLQARREDGLPLTIETIEIDVLVQAPV